MYIIVSYPSRADASTNEAYANGIFKQKASAAAVLFLNIKAINTTILPNGKLVKV